MDASTEGAGGDRAALDALLLAPLGDLDRPEDVADARDRLRRREIALRAVLEGLPDATVAAGRDGRIVFANGRAEELFGYGHDELLGQPVERLWAERVRARYAQNLALYFATDHPLRFTVRADGVRRDGTEFVGEMSWRIVETEAGPLLLAIGRDMTEQRAAMAKLERQSVAAAAVAALGERALAGADVGDLAGEAVERVQQTLHAARVEVHRDGATLATWSNGASPSAPAVRVEIRTGEDVFGDLTVLPCTPIGDDELSFLRSVAIVLATAMGRLRGDEQMRHEALHDPLTGLANRALCRERLLHALARRDQGAACVLFIDLDHFKRVNDSYGHAAGDGLLVALGHRLLATVRPADTVARIGGDEFVVVCEDIDEHTAVALGHRLAEAIHEPLEIEGVEHRMMASIGIALGRAGRRDPDGLLADADAAAYRAKAEGRGRVEVFDTRLRRHARERLQTAEALERALSLGQLRLAFQPIVALDGGAVVAHEALLRWDRPGGGANAPADFIPVAEESALIVEIGAWALTQACHESVQASGTGADGPGVWVNLSSRQLAQPDLCTLVEDALRASGLPPGRLRLELTEAGLQGAPKTALANLAELKALGVGLALDDFGTGASSLTRLRGTHVDAIKVDGSFVAALGIDDDATAIVAAIVSLAAALGLDAVAEGVEHEAQAALLRELGCPFAQGYLFGAPGPRIAG